MAMNNTRQYKKDDLFFIYSPTVGELEMFYLGRNTFFVDDITIRFDEFSEDKAWHFSGKGLQNLYGERIE